MNKRQRRKVAKMKARQTGTYQPRNVFRSSMVIHSTLFDINHPKNEKLVYLAERNLNRLAYVITKPNLVTLKNLTEDDVKYLQGASFNQLVSRMEEYFNYDRSYYKNPEAVDNATRQVMTEYFYEHNLESTRALDITLRRLIKQLDAIVKKYGGGTDGRAGANPFVIVKYKFIELR